MGHGESGRELQPTGGLDGDLNVEEENNCVLRGAGERISGRGELLVRGAAYALKPGTYRVLGLLRFRESRGRRCGARHSASVAAGGSGRMPARAAVSSASRSVASSGFAAAAKKVLKRAGSRARYSFSATA